MADPFIGELKLVPYNFAPRGWAFCDGQLLAISQNDALFALIGTTYGGDGRTTFGLPDLRGRVAIHSGQGPGLANYSQGEQGGSEGVALTVGQLPEHSHALGVATPIGDLTTSPGNVPATSPMALGYAYGELGPVTTMPAGTLENTGGAGPHDNMQPSLVLNYVIALEGIFPSRN